LSSQEHDHKACGVITSNDRLELGYL
jgi:hypothetical protein